MGYVEFDGKQYLDGRASDPRSFGWMQGFPPPPDKLVTFESGNYRRFPQIRWSFSHMREFMPTANVWRGQRMPTPFERADYSAEIDALTFTDSEGRKRRFDEVLPESYADGILVLHRGKIVYERYFGALEPHLPHECQSCTKSYTGTLAAVLVHEGILNEAQTVSHYLPELRGTAWEDATVRQAMDMRVGLVFNEEYSGERSDLATYRQAFGRLPRAIGYDGPGNACDLLRTVRKQGSHGKFHYQSLNTQVLAWLMMRVTGCSLQCLFQERIWAHLGCEENGSVELDPTGMPLAESGLNATLRDFARFGEMMRRGGEWQGKQIVPEAVVHDIQGCDPAEKNEIGYSYRSQWWVSHNELGSFEARGIHGQWLYIAPKVEMVTALFASHPIASRGIDPTVLPVMLALGRLLGTHS